MQAIVNLRWPVASLAGLMATLVLFIVLPGLAYNQSDPQMSAITVDFRDWNPESPPVVAVPKKKRVLPKAIDTPKPAPLAEAEPMQQKVLTEAPLPSDPSTSTESASSPETIQSTPANIKPVPVPIFRLTMLPRFAHKELPAFPPSMLQVGKEAVVQLEVLIDKEGRVREITIIHSGGEAFDEAAKKAIQNSTFIPGQVAGEAVASLYRAPVTFKLR